MLEAACDPPVPVRPVSSPPPHGGVAAVIGSGFGGLAAAVRLLARGWQVHVFEALEQPGGRARTFRQDGYTFDAGPTVITAPFLFEELWQLAGRRLADDVELLPVDPFYRIRFADGSSLHYNGDPAGMAAEVARLSPGDVDGYRRFIALSEHIFDVGFTRLAHVDFGRWQTMAAIIPDMVRLQSYRSVWGLVCRFIDDPRLRQAFSFHPLLVGGNPFTTTSIYALILFLERRFGVHYPRGGTGALVAGLVGLIRQMGGHLHVGRPVTGLDFEGRRVVAVRSAAAAGSDCDPAAPATLPCDAVVSNACVAWTYDTLVPAGLRRRWTPRRLERTHYSMSLFVWYFGTRRTYPDVAHHTILLGPRYRGLLDDIFVHHRLADDHSLYLHRPTASCPEMAPPGCDAFYVLSPVPHLDAEVDWERHAEPYRRAIARTLAATCLPDLEAQVTVSRVMTPQGFADELRSRKGAAFGMEPILQQSAYFRPHNRSEDVDGLFFVGASTHPGAGLPGVISSARVVGDMLAEGRAHGRLEAC